jgi:hypothetical protein
MWSQVPFVVLIALTSWSSIATSPGRSGGGSASGPVAVDVAREAGIYRWGHDWDAAVGDADLDGWPDVMITTHGDGSDLLYRNDHGVFSEISQGLFRKKDRHDCDWGDASADGLPDLYCTIGAGQGTSIKRNELWIQIPGGGFTNMAAAYGVEDNFGRGRRTVFIDVNHDPYPDLFVGNRYPRQDSIPSPNRLFINQGGTSFRDATEYGLDLEVGGDCAQAVDYNDDGWQDLLVCGQYDASTPDPNGLRLYRNNGGGSFTDVTSAVGISGVATSAVLVDLDGDGDRDLARIHQKGASVQLQSAGHFGTKIPIALFSRGRWIAAGDADGDGDSDLFLVQRCPKDLSPNLPDELLMNDGTGQSYTQATIPQTTQGCGDVVAPLDYNQDGKTDFLVLNGGPYTGQMPAGPVQLITLP